MNFMSNTNVCSIFSCSCPSRPPLLYYKILRIMLTINLEMI
jgi:hypothetical protein